MFALVQLHFTTTSLTLQSTLVLENLLWSLRGIKLGLICLPFLRRKETGQNHQNDSKFM